MTPDPATARKRVAAILHDIEQGGGAEGRRLAARLRDRFDELDDGKRVAFVMPSSLANGPSYARRQARRLAECVEALWGRGR